MKIARAAKQLAMLITVVALAVVTMACQGAVGPKGDDGPRGPAGPDGEDGAAGTPGTPGSDGVGAFRAWGMLPAIAYIKDVKDADNLNSPGDAIALDLSDYHRGGFEPYEYEVTYAGPETDTDRTLKAPSEEDGVLTVELDDAPKFSADYATSTPAGTTALLGYAVQTIMVTVTDAGHGAVTFTVNAARNRPPQVGTEEALTVTVGTLGKATKDALVKDLLGSDADASTDTCDAFNNCEAEIVVGAQDAGTTSHFTDDDGADEGSHIIMATSRDTSKATVTVKDNTIIVTGIAATRDREDDGTCKADTDVSPVLVDATATDRGNMESEPYRQIISVTVDEEPKRSRALPNEDVDIELGATDGVTIVTNLGAYFKDCETATLDWYALSSDDEVASIADADTNVSETQAFDGIKGFTKVMGPDLVVNTLLEDMVTIHVVAVDAVGQYVMQSFELTIEEAE